MRKLPHTAYVSTLAAWLAWSNACSAESAVYPPGRYRIEWQTVLPHLEEMRRIKETRTQCLSGTATELFPVMTQPALRGCRITLAEDGPAGAFVVHCQTELVATGHARIVRDHAGTKGDLDIKMGGKNMTFSQHVRATRLGACSD